MTEPSLPEESIFAQALEITSPSERAAFLDRACGNNQALRAEVDALLHAHEQSGDLLDLPEKLPATVDQPNREAPGTIIGPYKLLEQIGEGGMGTVWMAEQTEPIRRRVAVKVVKEGMDSKQVLARFEVERQALALMEHPNIAKVLDAGKTPSGRPFFVMELVKGKPITRYCDDKRLAVRERLELFADVCRAVQHAHQKGIIHRDLKPSNVLVAPYDGKPVVKVIDFGVAKATGQQLTDKTLVTGFGALVGTPEYMSPEQAEINNQDIDTRSDIYSLGVLLYELLTGSTPLTRKRSREAALLEVLRVIREEEPPRPSTRLSDSKDSLASISAQRQTEPAKLTKQVRGELDWIVMKALEKDRNRRYETANGLVMDVQRYLADEPVQACPPSAWYRLRKFLRRHKGPVLAAVGFVLLLVAGIAGTTTGLLREFAAQRHTVKERDDKEEARRQTRQALNAMTDEVVEELLGAQVQLTDKSRHFLKKVLDSHAAFAAAKADDPEGRQSRADGYYRVGRIRYFLGEFKEAEAAYREAVALQKQLAEVFPDRLDFRHDLALSHHYLGMLLHDSHRWQEAEETFGEAVALGKQLTAESTRVEYRHELAKSETSLAYVLLAVNKPEEAETLFRDALAIDEQVAREFPEETKYQQSVAISYYALSMLFFNTNRAKEAEAACRQAVELGRQLADKFRDRPEFRHDLAQTYIHLGVMLQSTHRPEEAEKAWREAVTIAKQLAAQFPTRTEYRLELALSLNNLGKLLVNAHRLAESEEAWRETLALFQQLAIEAPTRPDFRLQVVRGYHNVGAVLHRSKRRKEAEEAWRKAVKIGQELVHDYPDRIFYRHQVILSYGHLALQLQETGRPAEAEQAWPQILELSKPVTDDTELAAIYCQLGQELQAVHGPLDRVILVYRESLRLNHADAEAHYRLGNVFFPSRPDEAIAEYREAIRIEKDHAQAHNNLGNALAIKGKLDEAIAEYREAIRIQKNLPQAHQNLGRALQEKGQLKEAIAEYRETLRLNKNNVQAQTQLRQAVQLARLDERLPAVLKGADNPKDADERLAFAMLCQQTYRQQYAAAVRFFAAAFDEQPGLAEKQEIPHRYNAACAAALAGCGKGRDAVALDEKERSRLRQQALAWLQAELKAWGHRVDKEPDKAALAAGVLRHWLEDSDFTDVRGAPALAKLPETERQAWQQLWKDVADLLRRTQEKPVPATKK